VSIESQLLKKKSQLDPFIKKKLLTP